MSTDQVPRDDEIQFLASLPPSAGAIAIDGESNGGGRVRLDIPGTDLAALLLLTLGAVMGLTFGLILGRARACLSAMLPAVVLPMPHLLSSVPVTITGYSSTEDQTDGDPFTAAWGDDVRTLRARGYVTLAVSRDLETLLPPGTVLMVADRMHHRWTRRVDVHFVSRGEAVRFGVRTGTVEVGR